MTLKSNMLEAVAIQAQIYHQREEELKQERERLIIKMREAKAAHASNQEIADKIGISRQRVSQYLQRS